MLSNIWDLERCAISRQKMLNSYVHIQKLPEFLLGIKLPNDGVPGMSNPCKFAIENMSRPFQLKHCTHIDLNDLMVNIDEHELDLFKRKDPGLVGLQGSVLQMPCLIAV